VGHSLPLFVPAYIVQLKGSHGKALFYNHPFCSAMRAASFDCERLAREVKPIMIVA
jgi:hypothetical protein